MAMIRQANETDFSRLVDLYKKFFPTHNVFEKNNDEIIRYLAEQSQKNSLIIYEQDSQIKGAMYLVNFQANIDGSHKVWKFRHFAFENEDIGKQLLEEGEKIIQKESKTSKIELTIAETEPGINFYKANGYEQEGSLRNHYRWGETCFILSKSFSE